MFSAATRGDAYAAVDQAVQARLGNREYARYLQEPQRPVFQRQVLAATTAGASLDEVLDVAATRDFTGVRSVSAAMHGRVEASALGRQAAGRTVTWAERVPETVRPQTRAVGVALAEAMDARAHELAQRQTEAPERWVQVTLGAFPAQGSDQLKADWLGRVGTAASYREAAGITDPNQVIGPAPQGHPELAEAHASAASALEIRTEDQMVYAMTRAELEATQAEYARVAQLAPPEVSAELKTERTAELEARSRGAELAELGQAEAGRAWLAQADAADVRATELEGKAEVYAAWEEDHRAERDAAELAQAELDRRNAAERQRQAERERAAEREDLDHAEPSAEEPRANRAAEEATADSSRGEFSQANTGTPAGTPAPIADPELAEAMAELDAHQAERQEAAEERAAELAERQEEAAVREASRHAAEAEADMAAATSPEAWVPGRDTPSWAGPAASAAAPAPAAEPTGPEAGL
jgi:hypothetical protein